MLATNKLFIIYAILVVVIAQVHCDDFMCYICDDCTKVTKDTPKEKCDETFFEKATTDTTTTSSTTTAATSTTVQQNASTANGTPPTPPTEGPIGTTTGLPTPPNPGTVAGSIDTKLLTLNETTTQQPASTETPTTLTSNIENLETTFLPPLNISQQPSEIVMRQKRAINDQDLTYHCYSVQKSVNGTTVTSRGCSRIRSKEAVCTTLKQANNNTNYSKCTACSNTLCNSSSSLQISLVAILLGLMGTLLFKTTA